jgi:hypothetical protein
MEGQGPDSNDSHPNVKPRITKRQSLSNSVTLKGTDNSTKNESKIGKSVPYAQAKRSA